MMEVEGLFIVGEAYGRLWCTNQFLEEIRLFLKKTYAAFGLCSAGYLKSVQDKLSCPPHITCQLSDLLHAPIRGMQFLHVFL
jgi:hypothetical protein